MVVVAVPEGVLQPICALLDLGETGSLMRRRWPNSARRWPELERTPSARILKAMRASGENFFRYARRLSEQHRRHFESRPLAEERIRVFTEAAERSLREQAEIEAADAVSFDEFLARYFAQS